MKSITFRCKRSGNLVSFSLEGDIAGLRKHEGYEELKDEIQEVQVKAPTQEVLKRPGRPKRIVDESLPSFMG